MIKKGRRGNGERNYLLEWEVKKMGRTIYGK